MSRPGPQRRHRIPNALLCAALIASWAMLSGCTADKASPDEASRSPRTAGELLTSAGDTLAAASGLAFTVEQSGSTVYIDEDDLLGFVSADGRFASPHSADALVTVDLSGLTAEIGAVAIDGAVWITNPISGAWEPAPPNLAFDPAAVFSAESGLPAVLRTGMADASVVDGTGDQHHLRGTVSADDVSTLTGGLTAVATEMDIFIDPDSNEVRRLEFEIPVDDGASSWLIQLDDYGINPEITDPTGG